MFIYCFCSLAFNSAHIASPHLTESATIVKQPTQYIMEAGPRIGETATIILRCGAEGWPAPTYQWFKVRTSKYNEVPLSKHLKLLSLLFYLFLRVIS